MSFTVNEMNADFPPGSICAYLGTTSPDGWVIMNGVQRTDNSDGKYNRVAALTIGTGGTGTTNYTPPNYNGAFLRGAGTNGTNSGSSLGGFQSDAYQSHTHSINDPGHTHTTNIAYLRWNTDGSASNGGDGNGTSSNSIESSSTGVTVNTDVRNSSGTAIGGSETRPYNYSVNWILKL